MSLHHKLFLGAVLAAAGAQAADTPLPPPSAQEITAVTVFGRLNKKPSDTIRRLDSSRASSCAFFGTSTSHGDALIDSYLDHFHGKERSTGDTAPAGTEGADNNPAGSFSDTSPNGDASTGNASLTVQEAAVAGDDPMAASTKCGRMDRASAAGRNYIKRKDKTLDDAFAAYDAGDFAKALLNFKANYTKLGEDESALMLGNMTLYGQGTKPDTKGAIGWYTKLTEGRLSKEQYSVFNPKEPERATARVEALLKLARIYMAGFDVPKDPAKARALYQNAVELNHIPSHYGLARMLESGYGGAKDPQAAAKLLETAAEHGYAPAQSALAAMYWNGSGKAQDKSAAFSWYQQAAFNPRPDSKKPFAQYALAEMYDQGVGTKADPARALAFYKLAAVAGHPDAQNALATYFYTGQIVNKDLPLARKLFITAASQAQSDAMVNAAAMLFKGEGGEPDLLQASIWLRLATRLGHPRSQAMSQLLEGKLTSEQRAKAEAVLAPKATKKTP